MEHILKYLPALFHSLVSKDNFLGGTIGKFLEELEVCFLKI